MVDGCLRRKKNLDVFGQSISNGIYRLGFFLFLYVYVALTTNLQRFSSSSSSSFSSHFSSIHVSRRDPLQLDLFFLPLLPCLTCVVCARDVGKRKENGDWNAQKSVVEKKELFFLSFLFLFFC